MEKETHIDVFEQSRVRSLKPKTSYLKTPFTSSNKKNSSASSNKKINPYCFCI